VTCINRRELLRAGLGAVGILASPARSFAASSAENPIANTQHGDVRGFVENGICVFKGIRYGADTHGRRFKPPDLPLPWTSPIDTFEYGASAPQDQSTERISEDCLFLNVWTPGVESDAKRPVMFYIHGGAYSHGSGSSPLYDGGELARRGDVVVVSVNHRLNAFGYLYLQRPGGEEYADSGNVGQIDLILALNWVRQNIANFGGDPQRVLAFGQSGGGAKIATLMAMPLARNLFHRAATMSGQQVTASGPANAALRAKAFMDAINVAADDLASLRSMPIDKLLVGLATADPVLPYGSVYFGPVLDMRSLDRHPFYPDAPGQSADIPMIIGNTRDETRAFHTDPHLYELDWHELPELLIGNMRVDISPDFVVDEYRKIYPDYSASQVFFAATTAARSWRGAIIEAEERARQERDNTYAYQLDWTSPLEPQLGAPHTLDIPLVFGNLAAIGSITGTGKDARTVSAMMSDAFIAFARDGTPRSKRLPDWVPYRLPGRETMIIANAPRMENDPRGAERRVFERVPYVQPGT
jgi:para-nitrobenzyl esterase